MQSCPAGKCFGVSLRKLENQRLQCGVGLRVRDTRLQANARIEAFRLVAGDLQRQIYIAITPGKSRPGNADDRCSSCDQLHGFTENRRIAVEMPLPELVAQHDDRLRILAVDRI